MDRHGCQACSFAMVSKAKRYLLPLWNISRVHGFPLLLVARPFSGLVSATDECGASGIFFSGGRGVLGRDCVIGGELLANFC